MAISSLFGGVPKKKVNAYICVLYVNSVALLLLRLLFFVLLDFLLDLFILFYISISDFVDWEFLIRNEISYYQFNKNLAVYNKLLILKVYS